MSIASSSWSEEGGPGLGAVGTTWPMATRVGGEG